MEGARRRRAGGRAAAAGPVQLSPDQAMQQIRKLESEMFRLARNLEFEKAAQLRDEIADDPPQRARRGSRPPGRLVTIGETSSMRLASLGSLVLCAILSNPAGAAQPILVLQSDFGLLDGAVASMKGVAVGVSPDIHIYDLTHQIEPYNIWQGALRLAQTAEYWPAGTVFVSVVDPGVGTDRKSIVLRSKSGHYFVTPDNGTLTFVTPRLGIDAVREIDEAVNRRTCEASFSSP